MKQFAFAKNIMLNKKKKYDMKFIRKWFNYWKNDFRNCYDIEDLCIASLVFIVVHATIITIMFGYVELWITAPIAATVITVVFGLPVIGVFIILNSINSKDNY